MAKKGPCWEGYEMVGMKTKNGRKVPNCVPKPKKAQKGLSVDHAKSHRPIMETETSGEYKKRSEYFGKFVKHNSADIELSNPSLVSYYGDLLK